MEENGKRAEARTLIEYDKDTQISLFTCCKETKPLTNFTIKEFIQTIKVGGYKEQIEKVRAAKTKDERTELKNKLPAATIAGTFTERKKECLQTHSGMCCIDFDNVPDLETAKNKLSHDKFTYCCFITVSGNGLAVIVKIPQCSTESHKEAYKRLCEYYKLEYGFEADTAPQSVVSLRYISYDPDIFVNENSALFIPETKTIETKERETITTQSKTFSNGCTPYGTAALNGLVNDMAAAAEGTRNATLNKVAFRCGQLVSGGELSEVAGEQIKQAARQTGLSEAEILQTFSSGYSDSKKQPTSAPPQPTINVQQINEKPSLPIPIPAQRDFLKELEQYEILRSVPPEEPEPLLFFDDIIVWRKNGISIIQGQAKSCKTTLITLLIEKLLSQNENIKIVLFDTEQDGWEAYEIQTLIYKKMGWDEEKNNEQVRVFSLRTIDTKSKKEIILNTIPLLNADVYFIDGITDLLVSINTEEETKETVWELTKIATIHSCHICSIIHTNGREEKARGWIGSELLRKLQCCITVSKKLEAHTADVSIYGRFAPICKKSFFPREMDSKLPQWCEIEQTPINTGLEFFYEILSKGVKMRSKELRTEIMKVKKIKDGQCYNIIKAAQKQKIIAQEKERGKYYIIEKFDENIEFDENDTLF